MQTIVVGRIQQLIVVQAIYLLKAKAMNNKQLTVKLFIVIVIKLMALTAIWALFINHSHVNVSADSMAQHLETQKD